MLLTAFQSRSYAQTALPAPVLSDPVDQDTILVSELPVVLSWGLVPDAATYETQVFYETPSPGDEPIPFKFRVQSPTSVEIPEDELLAQLALDSDSTFFWRVRARNSASGVSDWSEVWRFTIAVPSDDTTNTPPRFDFELTAADRTTDEEVELSFTVRAFDDQGDAITYSIDQASLDEAMTIETVDDTTGVFRWTPDEMDGPGEFEVTVTATDDNAIPAFRDTTITVIVNEVNLPPELAAIGNQQGLVGQTLDFTAEASDPDFPANTLTFTLADTTVSGMAIDPASGAFTWTPLVSDTVQATVVVTDGGGLFDSETIELLIRAADDTTNTPPRFDFELTAADRTTDEEVELSFTVRAFDDQGMR